MIPVLTVKRPSKKIMNKYRGLICEMFYIHYEIHKVLCECLRKRKEG